MSILRLISDMRARLFAALAVFFMQPVEGYGPATTTDPESLSAVLRNGDVLLTEGNTRAAALIKRITRSTWSHVSMYVGPLEEGPDPRCIVEADMAQGVRAIRLSELEGLNVRVLRPIGLNDAARSRLAEWVVGQIGGEYDLKHAWVLARSFLGMPPKAPPGSFAPACLRTHLRWWVIPSCRSTRQSLPSARQTTGMSSPGISKGRRYSRSSAPRRTVELRRKHECSSNRSRLPVCPR